MKTVRSRTFLLTTLALVAPCFAVGAAPAAPMIKLDTRRILPMTDRVDGAALGDFDEDGRMDVAAVHSFSSNGVQIFRGLGSGRYAAAASITTTGRPMEITAADLNHDGHTDLAMTGAGPALIIVLGTGTGSFGAPVKYGSTQRSDDLATADFNGDGHLDVVVTHAFVGSVSVFPGTGTGSFGLAQSIPVPGSSSGVVTGDFKVDGHVDIAVDASGVVVLPGDGAGGFGPPLQSLGGIGFTGLTGDDVDEDGILDLLAANPTAGSVMVFRSAGDGTFSVAGQFPAAAGVDALAIGDLNADGRDDVVAGGTGLDVHVLLATGPGAFGGPVAYRAGNLPDTLIVADLDEDGRQDVLAGNTLGSDLAILPGNGLGRLAAEISLPLRWAQTPDLAAADFNEDGLADLAALNTYGPFIFECGGGGLAAGLDGPLDCGAGGTMLLTVLPRTGPATFGPPRDSSTRCSPVAMAVADFNLDGHLDVATANRGARDAFGICFAASLSILRGDGQGAFGTLVDLEVADEPDDVAAGDFNEDGIPDLVVAFGAARFVRIYRGSPGGGLIAGPALFMSSDPRALAVGDLNADGHLDVATGLAGNRRVAILRGDGAGQLIPIAECAPGTGGGVPRSLSIGDFDGDDVVDIAVAAPPSVSVMHRSGASFCLGASETIPIPAGASYIGAGDLDNDGVLDLLAADGNTHLSVVKPTRPPLAAEADAYGAFYSQVVATADFDDDGLLDVAVTSSVANSISVVRNVTAAAPRMVLAVDGPMVEWLGVAGASGYDVVRGGLGALRSSRGDFAAALEACVADDTASTFVMVPGDPERGDGWWFLARPILEAGPGTYDSGSPAQVGSADAEIAASALACP